MWSMLNYSDIMQYDQTLKNINYIHSITVESHFFVTVYFISLIRNILISDSVINTGKY